MSNPILRWGIISTARINEVILPAVERSNKSDCVAVASRSAERANEYASKWNIERSYGSYEKLLEDQDIDVIYNPLPNHLHAEWTIKALKAGKHVLTEKPMALSLIESDAIQEAAEQTGNIVAQCFMYRTQKRTDKVMELIQGGKIGDVCSIRGSFNFPLDDSDDIRWVPEFGGGSLWDIGCYPVSYARMVTGTSPTEVLSFAKRTEKRVDHTMTGMMRYPNGVIAQFDCSFMLPYLAQMEIRGTLGTLIIPSPFRCDQPHEIIILKDGREKQIKFKGQLSAFYTIADIESAILEGTAPRLGLPECREITQTLIELLAAAR